METAGNTVSVIVPTAEDSLSLSGTDDEYDGIEYDGLPVKCGMLAISLLCNSFEVTDCKDTCSDTDAVGLIGVNDYVVDVQAPFGGGEGLTVSARSWGPRGGD